VLAVSGRLTRPRRPFGGFDETTFLARRGIHAVLRARTVAVVGARGGVWGLLDRARETALAAFAGAGSDDAGKLVGALAIGADGELSPATTTAFQRSGLAHLLAVSGENVALLAALVLVAVWTAGGGRTLAQSVAIAAIVVYVGVVGPSPSVTRAGVAGVLTAVAWLASRPGDAWHLYGCGLAVLLVWNPYTLLDAGFQLSFAAVAAILVLAPRLRSWLEGVPVPAFARTGIAVSAACTLVTAPISWWHFGRLGLVAAVPANVLAMPAVPPILWLAVAAAVLHPLVPTAALALAGAARWPAVYLLEAARIGGRLDARLGGEATSVAVLAAAAAVAVTLLAAGLASRSRSRAPAERQFRRGRRARAP
jgi:competence protein ComEC